MSEMKNQETGPKVVADTGHDYDGIRELDNPAPFWWTMMFYLSIAFGVGYFAYYEMWGGPTLDEELATGLSRIEMVKREAPVSGPAEADFKLALETPAKLTAGQQVFSTKCSACHAADGGGMIGPNLTDSFWIHGNGTPVEIAKVVESGVLEKGMPPWGAVLSRDELVNVVAYVRSIKGHAVANAKAPQGQKVD